MSIAEEAAGVPLGSLSLPATGRSVAQRVGFYIALAAVSLVIWQLASSFTHPLFLPPPLVVLGSLADLLRDGQLARDVSASYARILAGWALGSVVERFCASFLASAATCWACS